MPLYDCLLLLKPHVRKEMMVDMVSRIGKRVYQRKGVVTDLKSFGTVQLGYGIKKLDGRYYQGQLMQMTMMVPPTFHKELHYLNKEDRLLRWIVRKHKSNAVYGLEKINDDEGSNEFRLFHRGIEEDDDEEDDEDDDDDGGDEDIDNVSDEKEVQ